MSNNIDNQFAGLEIDFNDAARFSKLLKDAATDMTCLHTIQAEMQGVVEQAKLEGANVDKAMVFTVALLAEWLGELIANRTINTDSAELVPPTERSSQ